jgi:hypothetical protein
MDSAETFSASFDAKYSFIVDQGLVTVLTEIVVLPDRVIEQCIADVLTGCG